MVNNIFIKQNIDILFVSAVSNNISSLPTTIKDYVFDFNQTNSCIIFPLISSFILPNNFLLTGSKNVESSG